MTTKPKVLLIITQDTKEHEARFIRQILEGAGVDVIHLDPSVRADLGGAEIGPAAIAQAGGMSIDEVRALGHEGKCQAVMIEGSIKLATALHDKVGLSGILAVGGSMGSTLAGAVMQRFPIGLPKLIISTMASGYTVPFVGLKDITMANAVVDHSGLNSISRDVYRNGALAVAGMAKGYVPSGKSDKPLVLITTLSTTEKTVRRIREALENDGCEVMVFHSSGAGGPTLDSIAAERDVALVLDLSLTEMVDYLNNGLANAGPDRGKAGIRRGIPTIFAPGNADFIIAGPVEQAVVQFPGKPYHVHNPALTAMRTGLPELKALADHLAALVTEANGPVRVFTPLHGFSNHDSPDGHIHDPSLPGPFADYLKSVMPANVPTTAIDSHFNDTAFADAIIAAARDMMETQ